jgi:flagellar protein FliS
MIDKALAAQGESISKAIAIIGEGLHASLDQSVGGPLAQELGALYTYMVSRLVHANLKNDVDALDEVERLLTELKSAWDSIRPDGGKSACQATASRVFASA